MQEMIIYISGRITGVEHAKFFKVDRQMKRIEEEQSEVYSHDRLRTD